MQYLEVVSLAHLIRFKDFDQIYLPALSNQHHTLYKNRVNFHSICH